MKCCVLPCTREQQSTPWVGLLVLCVSQNQKTFLLLLFVIRKLQLLAVLAHMKRKEDLFLLHRGRREG